MEKCHFQLFTNILFRNMTLVVVEVDLKGVSGGRKISQRLGCGERKEADLQPQSRQEILDRSPRKSEPRVLAWFVY